MLPVIRGKKLYFLLAFFNTIILLVLTSWFWSLPWLAGDEKLMIWATSAVRLMNREIPSSEDYALVNVSYDKTLIDKYDEFGFPVGNQAITDRQKLTRLIQIINQSDTKPKYVFCDIYFEEQTKDDSLLNAEFDRLGNYIISAHLNNDEKLKPSVLSDINTGLSDYVTGSVFEGVYKFQLYFKDSLRLTPLVIYEDLHNTESFRTGPFVKVGDQYTLNHFILNYRLLQRDILDIETGFNPVNLGELLFLSPEDIAEFLKDKIVVIGDFFEDDMHETMFEVTAGPVILINAYMSVLHQDTTVNLFFILIIFLAYFGLSFIAIYPEDMIEIYIKRKYGKIKWVGNLTTFMSYILGLITTSIITYFLFNIHLNVLMLGFYIFLVEKLSKLVHKKLVPENQGRVHLT